MIQENTSPPENVLPAKLLDIVSTVFPQAAFAATMIEITEANQWLSNHPLLSCWLSEEELSTLESFKLAKRRYEWFAGRVCAKWTAAAVRGAEELPDYKQIYIENRADGRPYVFFSKRQNGVPACDISISHSGRFAAALAADSLCGIDIQQSRETLLRVKDRYCAGSDEMLLKNRLASYPPITRLNLLWTAKEALRKALGYHSLPEFLQLNLSEIHHYGEGYFIFEFTHRNRQVTAACCNFRDYGIAVCCLEELFNARTSRG